MLLWGECLRVILVRCNQAAGTGDKTIIVVVFTDICQPFPGFGLIDLVLGEVTLDLVNRLVVLEGVMERGRDMNVGPPAFARPRDRLGEALVLFPGPDRLAHARFLGMMGHNQSGLEGPDRWLQDPLAPAGVVLLDIMPEPVRFALRGNQGAIDPG